MANLGHWQITFTQQGKPIQSGVLCGRRLPNHELGQPQPDLRIGDLVLQDGKQLRVNANLAGDGTKAYQATIYLDFDTGTIPTLSTDGIVWKGSLTQPEKEMAP